MGWEWKGADAVWSGAEDRGEEPSPGRTLMKGCVMFRGWMNLEMFGAPRKKIKKRKGAFKASAPFFVKSGLVLI